LAAAVAAVVAFVVVVVIGVAARDGPCTSDQRLEKKK